MNADYIVVGAGITGATLAWCLRQAGREVAVVDQRSHIGGNCYDTLDSRTGSRYHLYGPHAFRTRNEHLWHWLNGLVPFYPFTLRVKTVVGGKPEIWPPTQSYTVAAFGSSWTPAFEGAPRNFEEAALAQMPRAMYERFVRNYTEKHWGRPATELWPGLARRFRSGENDDDRLSRHPYQGLPYGGYSALVRSLLEGIPVFLGERYDALKWRHRRLLLFSGAIDTYFQYVHGHLAYRAMKHDHVVEPAAPPVLDAPIWNFPEPTIPRLRTVDWSHWQEPAWHSSIAGTLLSHAYAYEASGEDDKAYPVRTKDNLLRLRAYRLLATEARERSRVLFVGRLGDYAYYDMDQAFLRALSLARQVLGPEYRGIR